MSADNWTTCPRCTAERRARLIERASEVAAAYGTVPVEEFDEMRDSLAAEEATEPKSTFREDYEFYGAEDGTVHAAYCGSCSDCRLTVKFDYEHPFFPEAAR